MVVNITGWAAFWLMIAVVAVVSLILDAIIKIAQVRQIVKLLDKAIESGIKDEEEVADSIRNLVDRLNR